MHAPTLTFIILIISALFVSSLPVHVGSPYANDRRDLDLDLLTRGYDEYLVDRYFDENIGRSLEERADHLNDLLERNEDLQARFFLGKIFKGIVGIGKGIANKIKQKKQQKKLQRQRQAAQPGRRPAPPPPRKGKSRHHKRDLLEERELVEIYDRELDVEDVLARALDSILEKRYMEGSDELLF